MKVKIIQTQIILFKNNKQMIMRIMKKTIKLRIYLELKIYLKQ